MWNRFLKFSFSLLLTAISLRGVSGELTDTVPRPRILTEEENLQLHNRIRAEKDSIVAVLLSESTRSIMEDYSGRAVNEIPLEDGITPSGGRTYIVKIPTAAGFSFVPSVSLVYNSQASEGWAGYGWDIQGVPTITIINRSKYYHDIARGARITERGSVFALDGVPLVRNDQPETMSDYALITARGNILADPVTNIFGYVTSFNVLYPNGVSASFGCEESMLSNQQSYPVTQMIDINGNRISYAYLSDQSNGAKRLDAIRYGYDSSNNYSAEIAFIYTQTTDYVSKYYAGKALYHNYRLERIISKDGDTVICGLPLFYDNTDNVNLLKRIECISRQDSLRPLIFNYGYEAQSYLPPNYYLSKGQGLLLLAEYAYNTYDYAYKRGKFAYRSNNDGFLMYRNISNYEIIGYHYWNGQSYPNFGSPYPSNWTILYAPSLSDFTTMYNNITVGSGFQTIEAVDVDGDGVDELVKVNFNGTSGSNTILKITVYKSTDSGAPIQSSQFDIPVEGVVTSGNQPYPSKREYFWGDFLGNGKIQLVTIAFDRNYNASGQDYSQNSNMVLIDIDGQEKLLDSQLFIFPQNGPQRIISCDLDNDSQTELCYGTNTGLQSYRFSSGSFQLERTYMLLTDSVLASDTNPCFVTDLNGDGYIDIMRAPSANSGNSWSRYSFNGSSFSLSYVSLVSRDSDDSFFFMDLNRDGLADIIRLRGTDIGILMNLNGSSFGQYQSQSVSITTPRGIIPSNVIDYNGASSFIMIDGCYAYPFNYARLSPEMRHINKSVDSRGRLLLNTYSFLPQFSKDWCDSTSSVNNADGFAFKTLPMYVLSSEERYNREGYPRIKYEEKSYWYYDGVIHHHGLGFCGFSKIRMIDEGNSPRVVSDAYYNPMKLEVLTLRTVKHNFNGIPFFTTTNTYDSHTTTYGKLNPRLTQSVAVDSLSGITTTTTYTYGDYDLPSRIKTVRQIGSDTPLTQLQDYTYGHSLTSSKYVLGVVLEDSFESGTGQTPLFTWRDKTEYTYDALYHRTRSRRLVGRYRSNIFRGEPQEDTLSLRYGIDYSGNHLVSTTRWTYDSHGNVTSEKTVPYSATTFTGDTLVYDSNGRYLVSKTDALGHTTTYSGYNKFGKPTSVTDYHNHTTTFTYDNWGNLVSTTRPDGGVEQTTTVWGGDGLYTVTQTATGSPQTIVHYDALGREIKSGVKRFDGQWQYTNKEYDSRGRLSRVSLPYRGTSPVHWNTYHYDDHNRPDSICEASGRRTRWFYSGTSTTTVNDGITSTTTTDALGRVVCVTDAGGTITYTLRDDGQPSSIMAPDSLVTTFTYDDYGRQTRLVDPSLGTESDSYYWESSGVSHITHTNRRGTRAFSYDRFGRLTSILKAGGDEPGIFYAYDSDGRLSSILNDAGLGTKYTYDEFDRVASVKDTVPDGKWLQKVYTYGTGGVLSSIAYTCQSGYITTETYSYANGYNTGITLPNNVTVWSLTSENDLGMPTVITTGSITRQYGYTAYGLPTYRKMNNGTLQDFSYQFDPATGNLLNRSDGRTGVTESFGYDQLNRLVEITEGNTTKQIVYTDSGNITSIDGVGTLVYGGGTGVSPYEVSGLIPEPGQPGYRQRTVAYNSFDKPASVSEGDYTATFTYNASEDKVLTKVDEMGTGTILKRYYISDRYEYELEPITPTERLYLGGDAYSAPMVLQRTGANGTWTLYNIGRDYLGSITDIINNDNTASAYHYRYDPWGKLINYRVQPYFLGRGYTGHEHLPWFGLINANARLYDPLLGRFLSPDPYVQDPDFTQNYNRFSYCLNNPLKYTDESGEIIGTLITFAIQLPIFLYNGFVRPVVTFFRNPSESKGMLSDAWSTYAKRVQNAWEIDMGLWKSDEDLSEEEKNNSLKSRFTYEFMQTYFGYLVSHVFNNLYDVEVYSYHGATLVNRHTSVGNSGVTLGSYINGNNLDADAEADDIFAHEYGHTVQSQQLGSYYLFVVGAPSLISAWLHTKGLVNHHHQWYEVQANHLSANYFKKIGMPNVRATLEGSTNLSMTFSPDWYYYLSGSFIWAHIYFRY